MSCLLAKPYATMISRYVKSRHANIPVVYFANGGSCHLQHQLDMGMDALSVDWRISMETARKLVGPEAILAGNVDPVVLYADSNTIKSEVVKCIRHARGRHVLNLGHGVEQDMTEEAIEAFVDAAKSCAFTGS